MAWATLGDFDIDVLSGPTRLERLSAQDFVEIPLIQSAPQVQWMGPRLDEITLEVQLHAGIVDVATLRAGLESLLAEHEPVALVLGSGEDWGDWVVTEQRLVGTWTTADGELLSATVALTLKASPPDDGEQDAQKSQRQASARMAAAPRRRG